jgi:hypothetical protein
MKSKWWHGNYKLQVAILVLSGIVFSENASAQTGLDIINYVGQCGLSISGGYVQGYKNNQDNNSNNNSGVNNGAWQIITTLNTNPCTNQGDLEKIRQGNETKRELIRQENEKERELIRQENENRREFIRSNNQVISACLNARVQAVQKDVDPDVICKLTELQNNFSTVLPTKK